MSARNRQAALDSGSPRRAAGQVEARERFGEDWKRGTDALGDAWARPLHRYAAHLLRSGRTVETSYGYARNVRTLAQHAAARGLGPWEVTGPMLETWLLSGGWSGSTRKRLATAVREFYSWAIEAGHLGNSPAAGLGAVEHLAPGPAAWKVPESWVEPLSAYVLHLRASARTENTIRRYRDVLSRFARTAADPWAVTTEHLELWLSRPDWSAETKRTTRGALRRFYFWAEQSGRINRSPATILPTIRVRRYVPRPIPTDILLSALHGADDRLRLVMMLAAYAGLRRAEVAGLRWVDIEHGEPATVIVRGKGEHERRIPLHPDLSTALMTARLHTTSEYVFPSSARPGPVSPRWLGTLVSQQLPPGWTLHTLRHRFATQAYAVDRDIRAVQELMGHSKPETTARYAATPREALLSAVAGVGLGVAPTPGAPGPAITASG